MSIRGRARPAAAVNLAAEAARVRPVLEKHWLTTEQVLQRFGLTKRIWSRVRDYLHAHSRRNEDGEKEWHCGP